MMSACWVLSDKKVNDYRALNISMITCDINFSGFINFQYA